VKKSYHTIRKQGKVNEQELANFLIKNGQGLLPMVDLIEQCQMACDELIDVTGRAAIQAVLQLSAMETAGGPPQQGKRRSGEVVFYGRQPGQVFLSDRKLEVDRPRLRSKAPRSQEVEVPAYRAMQGQEQMRRGVLNLHGILAQNLLPDEAAAGRLRRIAVGIESSAFHPLEVPQLIEECFNQVLATAQAIHDPFEQSFFAMVHLPYLQPFDDVNKRVSRLAANIPFIKANLSPLSFTSVPRSTYTDAILGIHELNGVDLLKDVYIWAYERSAERYAAVRQSLGDPDPFKQLHREALRQLVGDVVRRRMDRKEAGAHIAEWVKSNIAWDEQGRFREMAESDLLSLHEGNFARLQVRPSEFAAWQIAWENKELIFPAPEERHDDSRDVIVFWGQDRAQRVRCAISREALDDHFHGDNINKLEVFRENRPAMTSREANTSPAGSNRTEPS